MPDLSPFAPDAHKPAKAAPDIAQCAGKSWARESGLPDRLEPIPGLGQRKHRREVVTPRNQCKFLCTETNVHQGKYIAENLQACDKAIKIDAIDLAIDGRRANGTDGPIRGLVRASLASFASMTLAARPA